VRELRGSRWRFQRRRRRWWWWWWLRGNIPYFFASLSFRDRERETHWPM